MATEYQIARADQPPGSTIDVDCGIRVDGPAKRWPGEILAAKQATLKRWLADVPDAHDILEALHMHRDFQPGKEYRLVSDKPAVKRYV